jgi:pectate lyase
MKASSLAAIGSMALAAVVAAQSTPAPVAAQLPLPAFPGAEGFGSRTAGGRGGEVYVVSNLNDSGLGSLRDAVSKSHRTIVFAVSGTIDLKSGLSVRQPYITIAGQTAPGDGICLRYYTFGVQTHDVVVRFIRCRLGDKMEQESDALDILNGCKDVILDHCSATWSVDECLSTSGDNQNITIQWCLIAEGMNHSIHAKGDHGYGSLARANGPVSWLHNLWAHNNSRNPRLGDNYGRDGKPPQFDVRNNVIYDYGEIASGLTQGIWTANYVGNYIKAGPSSRAKTPIHIDDNSTLGFFLEKNVFEGHDDFTKDNAKFVDKTEAAGKKIVSIVDKPYANPFPLVPVNTMSAEEAYKAALASVGACLPARDKADAQIVEEVRTRTGKIINSQDEVGGWPELKTKPAPVDTDKDGMPDEWEKAHGLNPNDPSDANADPDKDGYTNLEEYLNGTDPQKFVDYRDPKNNVDALTAGMMVQAK